MQGMHINRPFEARLRHTWFIQRWRSSKILKSIRKKNRRTWCIRAVYQYEWQIKRNAGA